MRFAVQADFVSFAHGAGDDGRRPPHMATEHEERRARPMRGEHIENQRRVACARSVVEGQREAIVYAPDATEHVAAGPLQKTRDVEERHVVRSLADTAPGKLCAPRKSSRAASRMRTSARRSARTRAT